ncbi:TetR/AcrR family transcriptional regulator [Nonomuraea sp. SYSU D8015]|uniref:TetR/AcrR family transcriptional regulator n=1 Tax=Nonomuraea sp. SYSU D8015 TaxID=2593644 RepID=UPI0016609D16|nr:TetR/AcrR family transcriptional regulator [Nonomuraea sp. SYSU D8015]
MSDRVKTTTGGGTRRAAQARATRRRILDAALELFLRQGYASTTLDQIAAAAGVAVQTVYFHFGNKATVLNEIIDVQSVGDDEPIPMLERPWVRQVREEPGGREALAIWLSNSRAVFARVAPIMKIVRDAAGADPAMAAQYETNQQQRFLAHQVLARQLAEKQALRPELTVEEAADIIFTLISFEVYLLLTDVRGWTPDRWERWAHTTLAETILR